MSTTTHDPATEVAERLAAARDTLSAHGVRLADDLLASLVRQRVHQSHAGRRRCTSYADPTGEQAVARAMRSGK